VFTSNYTSVYVLGKGKVSLELNSRKNLSLQNILHILDIHRNLTFANLLNSDGVRVTSNSRKAILSKVVNLWE